jgi:hypothetical protein
MCCITTRLRTRRALGKPKITRSALFNPNWSSFLLLSNRVTERVLLTRFICIFLCFLRSFSTSGESDPVPFPLSSRQQVWSITRGSLFEEVLVSIDTSNGVNMRFRLYASESHCVFTVGSGPFSQSLTEKNVDVIVRFDTALQSQGEFYTDANGLELKKRELNSRPWQPHYTDPQVLVQLLAV